MPAVVTSVHDVVVRRVGGGTSSCQSRLRGHNSQCLRPPQRKLKTVIKQNLRETNTSTRLKYVLFASLRQRAHSRQNVVGERQKQFRHARLFCVKCPRRQISDEVNTRIRPTQSRSGTTVNVYLVKIGLKSRRLTLA